MKAYFLKIVQILMKNNDFHCFLCLILDQDAARYYQNGVTLAEIGPKLAKVASKLRPSCGKLTQVGPKVAQFSHKLAQGCEKTR